MSDQKHDFTGLVVDDRAIAEAHAARVRSLEGTIRHMEFRAARWPREWSASLAAETSLWRRDLAQAKADEAIHLHGMQARARAMQARLDLVEGWIDAMPEPKEATA